MFFVSAAALSPLFIFQIQSGKGLTVDAGGVPIVRGSYIQFYKPDWSKGYFSTQNDPQTIQQVDYDTYKVSFQTPDKLSGGTITYHRDNDHLQVHYELKWGSDDPANAEVAAGLIWAPALENGKLLAAGKETRALNSYSYTGEGIGSRRFSDDSTDYQFSSSLGAVGETSSIPLTLFDARGYKQDFATGKRLWWLGSLAIPMEKGKTVAFDVNYQLNVGTKPLGELIKIAMKATPDPGALLPDTSHPPLIPKPQKAQLDWNHPLAYTAAFSFPAGEPEHMDLFKAAIARRFQIPPVSPNAKTIALDGGISKLGFVPGGYRITVTDNSVTILGEEDEGLRNGLNRLAAIAFLSNGKICFPTGTIIDQPQKDWRGVHLFVGKQATPFQTRLWNRVLRPLGFNKVVLQCERTDWDSLPGISTPETMSKADLVRLFSFYRSIAVDPIPLVQSYGHMEWLFANDKNKELAYDPQNPYAVDPENPKTADLLKKLWTEVVQSLHPDTVHFGLDEVNMIGKKPDPATQTKLWGKQLGLLESIAKTNNVEMMVWGDQCLAPGEAPDATNAETPQVASDRRLAIPRGSLIGDWHYTGEAMSTDYRKTLNIWKDAGMNPIASTWFNPDNIAAFGREAGLLHCGTLQTTWCGYESSEEGMLQAFNQFSAMVLAADYGWSARPESPSQLDYDPAEVFRKMYFGSPSPLAAVPGFGVGPQNDVGEPFTIGNIHYAHPCMFPLSSKITGTGQGASAMMVSTDVKATRLALACATTYPADEDGEPVADVLITLTNGKTILKKLVYGRDIRTTEDKAALPLADRGKDGVCSIQIEVGSLPQEISSVAIHCLNQYTGFSLRGLEAVK